MKTKDIMKILFGIAGIFISFTFNNTWMFSISVTNILNILLFVLVISQLVLWLLAADERPVWSDIVILFLVFFAGINLAYRPKMFLFLALLPAVYLFLERKSGSLKLLVLNGLSALVALTALSFSLSRYANPQGLLTATAILILLQGFILHHHYKIKSSGIIVLSDEGKP